MSDILEIQSGEQTPYIKLDPTACEVIIKGISYPEDTFTFYEPVVEWLETHLEEKICTTLSVKFDITYFNSSSSRIFIELFELFEDSSEEGVKLDVIWYYNPNDENSLEIGEDLIDEYETLKVNLVPRSV